jgi:hypothetical protein
MVETQVTHYGKRVWTVVVLRMLIDLTAAVLVLVVVTAFGALMVALSSNRWGIHLRHVQLSVAILGCIYVLILWAQTLRRHWTIAGEPTDQSGASRPEVTGAAADVRPDTNSD